jgi:hypothetical protein
LSAGERRRWDSSRIFIMGWFVLDSKETKYHRPAAVGKRVSWSVMQFARYTSLFLMIGRI